MPMLDSLRLELSYAARSLFRAPAFTATAILILALGIGMTSAMFSVFDAVLLERMPVRSQDRVVELSGTSGGAATEFPVSLAGFQRFRDHTRTLERAAGLAHWRVITTAFTDGDRRLNLRQAVVTENFFDVLGAVPAIGRLFRPGDERPWGAGRKSAFAVLSYGAWQRLFGGDSSVVGGHLYEPQMSWTVTIIGVAPQGLDYPRAAELWVASGYGSLDVVGRLRPGATTASARGEFLAFLDNDPELSQASGAHTIGAQVHTLGEMVTGDARPAVVVLSAGVGLLLLLVCMNVGNLFLLRAAGRAREMAIRRAIGATAADLFRQLLVESIIVAVAGGVLGVGLARALVAGLLHFAPTGLPQADLIGLAGAPLLIGALVTGLTVILFGVLPSLAAVRFNRMSPLRADTRSGTEVRTVRRLRQTLVACQLALAVVVLAGAGLLVRSLARLTDLDLGYSPDHLSVLSVTLPWDRMIADCRPGGATLSRADSIRWNRCYLTRSFDAHDRIMAQLRLARDVVSVSPVAVPPFLGSNVWMTKIVAERQSETEGKSNPWFGLDFVGPEFFRTMNVPIVTGRGFTDADSEGTPLVAIVSEDVARRLWPNEDPVGKRFHAPNQESPDSLVTIVGVVPDFHYREYRDATPMVLEPFRQVFAQGYFVVRERASSPATLAAIQHAVHDGGGEFVSAKPIDDLIQPQLAAPRFDALLLSLFASAAVILAAIGLYGTMASAVRQQTREFGVRVALGATPARVRRMVLGRALILSGCGIATGLIGAAIASRLLTSMLFEVSASDPLTLIGVSLLLLAVTVLAAYIPARGATRIDPAIALRAE
jgi:putative ABC transport system permease protein